MSTKRAKIDTAGDSTASVRQLRPGERTYQVLKDRLLDGSYTAEQRLSPDEIAAELDVSRQPVYDALRRLSAEGLIAITPQVGCRVIGYELDEIRDFFDLFAGLEGAACALAATRRTEEDVAELRRVHERIAAATRLSRAEERARRYRTLNREFHSRIHRMCGTAIVELLCSSLYDRSDFMINSVGGRSPLGNSINERHAEHERLLRALEAGDPKAAQHAVEDHLRGTVALIEAAIGLTGPRVARR
jgi:DNA-binding GntR family transcriptional regulator